MKLHRQRDKDKTGIYCIRNTINQKVYIGKAKCIYVRMKGHNTALNTRNKDENPHLINSWHKYGKDNFEYLVLEYLPFEPNLIAERELFWIKNYNATDPSKGYNLRLDSSTGMITHESTRVKLRAAQRRRCENPEHKVRLREYILKYREDNPNWKEQMSKAVSESKRIYTFEQYTRDNILVRIWKSVEEIVSHNPSYKWQNIYSVCNGYKKTYMGYIWKKLKI